MCGICGKFKFNFTDSIDQGLIEKMCNAIRHRGPDSQGLFIDGNIGMGVRRLNIIDANRGQQPLSNENDELHIVFNGEIYNFKELKQDLESKKHHFRTHCDTEVIIHLFEEYGLESIKYLNGMFAFAIWDKKEKRLLLARDRFGIKPLFYSVQSNYISFGSEIKALLCDKELSTELDSAALHDYLSYNYIPSPRTLFKNISSLSPGHFLLCSAKGMVIQKYWDTNFVIQKSFSQNFYMEKFLELLKQAILRQLDSEKTVGIFLSGGLDSATLAYIASHFGGVPLKAFTAQFNESLFDASEDALFVAKKLNIPCTKILIGPETFKLLPKIIESCDNLVADPAIMPLYIMSKFAKNENIDVVLSGEGADELLCGYDAYIADAMSFYYNRLLPRWIRNKALKWSRILPETNWPVGINFRVKHFLNGAKYPLSRAHYYWRLVFNEEEKALLYNGQFKDVIFSDSYDIYNAYLEDAEDMSDFNRIINADLKILLASFMLPKTDNAGMAWGLEIRVPFLDNDLAEFITQMPFELKLNKFCTKFILKQAMDRKLDHKTVYARKKAFSVPIGPWIKDQSRDMVRDYLSQDRMKSMGYFNARYVDQLLQRHFSGKEDNTWKIWGLLNFSIWHSLFVG